MMICCPRCGYLLNGCLFYLLPINADYYLKGCEVLMEEMVEFFDYINTGGDNVKTKQFMFGRSARD